MSEQKLEGIPISEFAAQSPENEKIVEDMRKALANGEVNLCACMGPIGNDPHCPCTMKSMGLTPTNLWTSEKIAELHSALGKFWPESKDQP